MNQLERSTAKLLDLAKCKYIRFENYRCFKCGQVQNAKGTGWPDFFVYSPFLAAIECKSGRDKLSMKQAYILQQLMTLSMGACKVIILKDNVDELLSYLRWNRLIP